MSFTIFWNDKTYFKAIKTRSLKSRKIAIILKGLTHGFVQKWPFFQVLFFQAIWARKMYLRYFRTKKTPFLGQKNKKFKKSKNCHYSKGVNPWFCTKMAIFPSSFFLGNMGQENVFTIFQNKKNTFFRPKKQKVRKVE